MGVIQVVCNRPGAGKTCLIGTLLSNLTQQGKNAGYYKPFSSSPAPDLDVSFVSQQLLSNSSPQVLAPRPLPSNSGASSISQPVLDSISTLAATTDLTLVEGPDLTLDDGQPSSIASELVSLTDSKAILVVQYERDLDAATVGTLAEPFRERLIGLVINHAPKICFRGGKRRF